MKLYTTPVYNWRKVKAQGIEFLDSTVKTGNKIFAPTWPLLAKYKAKMIDEDEYTECYYQLMRESYINNRMEWDKLFEFDSLAIGCYCAAGKFCHRLLLKDILISIAESRGMVIEYLGEL